MSPAPRKRFGQNFLTDHAVIDHIIDAVDPGPPDVVVEIGPGRGALTHPLLESGCTLHVVELDRDLAAQWRMHQQDDFTVHEMDALKFDFTALPKPLRLVGNLPYNISSPLLFHFAANKQHFSDLHVMLQKEVADRLAAQPGDQNYGRMPLMMALSFEVESLFDVPPEAFFPAPKVTSSVVRLTPVTPHFAPRDPTIYAKLVAQAFSQRRKTLRKSLKGVLDATDFEACEIDASRRPQTLSPNEFARLAAHLDKTTLDDQASDDRH